MQLSFSKSLFFSGLLIAGVVIGAHRLLASRPDRWARPPAMVAVHYQPVAIEPGRFGPLRIAGAWRLTSTEPRLGGVSGMAVDRAGLLALTDSGVTIRLPKPAAASAWQVASFHDLPAGPGSADTKAGRDGEALVKDAHGRGWWVGFENRHSAWLFNADFSKVERRIRLRRMGWSPNQGIEGALSTDSGLLLFPESGGEMVQVGARGIERTKLDNRFGTVADAARLPDGRKIVLARTFSPAGFSAKVLELRGRQLLLVARLALGRLDNPEAIAAETLPDGTTRLWLMTDNDYRRRVPTLLIAFDWPN